MHLSIRKNDKPHLIWHFLPLAMFLSLGALGVQTAGADHVTEADIERFVRARIDIGESMGSFFKNRKRPQFGPEGGGPSMDELRKLEKEINNHIAQILSAYDLTIEQYQTEKEDVFSDEEGVQRFLAAHPDLKARYEKIPVSPRRGRR
ncbi:MAG: hypothetical protein ACE5FY_01535 [Nitrospiria bacterium]